MLTSPVSHPRVCHLDSQFAPSSFSRSSLVLRPQRSERKETIAGRNVSFRLRWVRLRPTNELGSDTVELDQFISRTGTLRSNSTGNPTLDAISNNGLRANTVYAVRRNTSRYNVNPAAWIQQDKELHGTQPS